MVQGLPEHRVCSTFLGESIYRWVQGWRAESGRVCWNAMACEHKADTDISIKGCMPAQWDFPAPLPRLCKDACLVLRLQAAAGNWFSAVNQDCGWSDAAVICALTLWYLELRGTCSQRFLHMFLSNGLACNLRAKSWQKDIASFKDIPLFGQEGSDVATMPFFQLNSNHVSPGLGNRTKRETNNIKLAWKESNWVQSGNPKSGTRKVSAI